MSITPRTKAIIAGAGIVVALAVGTAVVVGAAADDDPAEPAIPVEPDGGIGDTPMPVEPDGGIGDTPADEFPSDAARDEARRLLGLDEADLPVDVRIARKGDEHFMLTEDYVLGRVTVELDASGDRYRVTSATVELPDGPETFELTAG